MNTTLIQTSEQTVQSETTEAKPTITELNMVEMVYIGGGMGNVAFM